MLLYNMRQAAVWSAFSISYWWLRLICRDREMFDVGSVVMFYGVWRAARTFPNESTNVPSWKPEPRPSAWSLSPCLTFLPFLSTSFTLLSRSPLHLTPHTLISVSYVSTTHSIYFYSHNLTTFNLHSPLPSIFIPTLTKMITVHTNILILPAYTLTTPVHKLIASINKATHRAHKYKHANLTCKQSGHLLSRHSHL